MACNHKNEEGYPTIKYDSPYEMRNSDMHCTQCGAEGSREEFENGLVKPKKIKNSNCDEKYMYEVYGNDCVEGDIEGSSVYYKSFSIIVNTDNEKEAILTGKKYASINKKPYGHIYCNKVKIINPSDLEVDEYFDKVVLFTKDGAKTIFNNNGEFRRFCHHNKIYYDFETHKTLKNNEVYGCFFGENQVVDNNLLNQHDIKW